MFEEPYDRLGLQGLSHAQDARGGASSGKPPLTICETPLTPNLACGCLEQAPQAHFRIFLQPEEEINPILLNVHDIRQRFQESPYRFNSDRLWRKEGIHWRGPCAMVELYHIRLLRTRTGPGG